MKRFEFGNLDWSICGIVDAESKKEAIKKIKEEYNGYNSSWSIRQIRPIRQK